MMERRSSRDRSLERSSWDLWMREEEEGEKDGEKREVGRRRREEGRKGRGGGRKGGREDGSRTKVVEVLL